MHPKQVQTSTTPKVSSRAGTLGRRSAIPVGLVVFALAIGSLVTCGLWAASKGDRQSDKRMRTVLGWVFTGHRRQKGTSITNQASQTAGLLSG